MTKKEFYFLYSNLKACKIFGNSKLQTGQRIIILKIIGFLHPFGAYESVKSA